MYIRDVAEEFYEALGLDAREYDKYVIEKTNETSEVFPIVLDVNNDFADLKIIVNNKKSFKIDSSSNNKFIKTLSKLPTYIKRL